MVLITFRAENSYLNVMTTILSQPQVFAVSYFIKVDE